MTGLALVGEMVLVAALVWGLYALRDRLGLAPLYAFLAATQYLQGILAQTVYLRLTDGVVASPGSVVLFSGNLFALLFIYLREGVPAARTAIYSILLANVTLAFFVVFTGLQLQLPGAENVLQVPEGFFAVNLRSYIAGVATILVDSVLMLVLYELLFSQLVWIPLLPRLLMALLGVLYFDSLVYVVTAFWGRDDFGEVLRGQFAGKSIAGVTYGLLLWGYQVAVARRDPAQAEVRPREFRDVFSIFAWRARYEQVAAELEQSQERLRLAGGIAHDFGNILTAVDSFAALLAERLGTDHPAQKDLEGIREGAARGRGLIRQLLAVGRRQPLAPRTLDLGAAVHGMERMLRTLLGARYQILFDVTPEVPAVAADPGQMEQVLLNLVINARDAMPAGGTIRVGVRSNTVRDEEQVATGTLRPGAYVALVVEDAGTGISPDTLEHVFEPFYSTKGAMGSGLGLSIVYGIVTQSGGAIRVEPTGATGTRFTVLLPVAPEDFRTPPPPVALHAAV